MFQTEGTVTANGTGRGWDFLGSRNRRWERQKHDFVGMRRPVPTWSWAQVFGLLAGCRERPLLQPDLCFIKLTGFVLKTERRRNEARRPTVGQMPTRCFRMAVVKREWAVRQERV